MSKKPSRNTGLNRRAQRRRAEGGSDSTDDRVRFSFTSDLMIALRLRVLLLKWLFQIFTPSFSALVLWSSVFYPSRHFAGR
jgi:hypothetical protein